MKNTQPLKKLEETYEKRTQRLTFDYMRDMLVEIRCSRKWHLNPHDTLDYEKSCTEKFRRLWAKRHKTSIGVYGIPLVEKGQ